MVLASCNENNKKNTAHSHEHEEYTCPMHPQIVSDEPGQCPICGMDLVKKGGSGTSQEIAGELNYLLKPTNTATVSSIQTVSPVLKTMEVKTAAKGVIAYDTRRAYTIPVKSGGRIEKLYIQYNFQPVRKGQKILEIYSPDLLTAQRELLYLIKEDSENLPLIESAKQRLRLLGVTEDQIRKLITSEKESYSFGVYSPYNGYVVEESELGSSMSAGSSPTGGSMGGGMESSGPPAQVQASSPGIGKQLNIREGMYVTTGQTVFRVVNTDKVWAEFDVYQEDASVVKVNDPIEITTGKTEGEAIEAKVDFVVPFYSEGGSFTKIRVYLSNEEDEFKIGQLVSGTFKTKVEDALWIPATAVMDLGNKRVVFLKKGEVFIPVQVTTGRQSENWVELKEGLGKEDHISHNAQFMVDSESFIKVN